MFLIWDAFKYIVRKENSNQVGIVIKQMNRSDEAIEAIKSFVISALMILENLLAMC